MVSGGRSWDAKGGWSSSNSSSINLAASSGCSISCTAVLQIPQALHQGSPRQAGFPQKVWNSSVMSSLFALNNLNILLQKSGAWKQQVAMQYFDQRDLPSVETRKALGCSVPSAARALLGA